MVWIFTLIKIGIGIEWINVIITHKLLYRQAKLPDIVGTMEAPSRIHSTR